MKKFTMIAAILLAGCDPGASVIVPKVTPPELEDCQLIDWNPTGARSYVVIRCPNSSTTTTYMQGKINQTVMVIDGVRYAKE